VEPVDYLVLGHVCEDLTPQGPVLGGSAAFAALGARALGMRVGVVTSAAASVEPLLEPLRSVGRVRVPADHTTQFVNEYTPHGRSQILRNRAGLLDTSHIPPAWRGASIVHLAPVAQELPSEMIDSFSASVMAVTAQGWLRDWDRRGRVFSRSWPDAPHVLGRVHAAVLSIEDLGDDETLADQYGSLSRLLVVTRGAAGCTLYCQGRKLQIQAPPRTQVDPTGAGDVFAAALFVRLYLGDPPEQAAQFATCMAADFVTQPRLAGLPQPESVRPAAAGSSGESSEP
jgi:sugar/nucleoside kinase (ribokinase family)